MIDDDIYNDQPTTKLKIDTEKLLLFMKENGLPPKGASCVREDYWVQATKAAYNVKTVSQRLAKVVSSYWHKDLYNFEQNLSKQAN